MDWSAILAAFWAVIVLAMAYSFEMYKKAAKKSGEAFDLSKSKRTITISVILGTVAAVLTYSKGWTLAEVETWGTNSGLWAFIVVLIDQAIAYFSGPKDETAKAKLKAEIEADLEDAVKIGEKVISAETPPKATEKPAVAPETPASQPATQGGPAPPSHP